MESKSKHNRCKLCGKSRSGIYTDNVGADFDDITEYCQECAKKVLLQRQIRAIIPKKYRNARFSGLSKGLQDVIHHLNGKGLFLWGIPGAGKTYAMCVLIRKFLRQGFSVQRTTFTALTLKIRHTFKPRTIQTDSGEYINTYSDLDGEEVREVLSEQDVLMPLIEVPKLFIEDIGGDKDRETPFAVRTLEHLLDERIEKCLPTFITSNKSVTELATTFDDRIASRIAGSCEIVKLSGKDRRKNRNG